MDDVAALSVEALARELQAKADTDALAKVSTRGGVPLASGGVPLASGGVPLASGVFRPRVAPRSLPIVLTKTTGDKIATIGPTARRA